MRLETIDDLTAHLETLFAQIGLTPEQVSPIGGHGLMFLVPGKVKPVLEGLKPHTHPDCWDGEPSFWGYRNEDENFLLTLKSAPRSVLCMATVMSLHKQYLEQFDHDPA